MFVISSLVALVVVLSAQASPTPSVEPVGERCTGTISSLDDVAAAQACTTININAFTVPAGETFAISAATGTTINLLGTVTFAYKIWAGPLFTLSGTSITFNGNGHTFDGLGAKYWDGHGTNDGYVKPVPMLRFTNTGTVSDFTVLNSPARAISLGNSKASLVVQKVTIDNSAGDAGALGHNTDCFDISATGGTTVQNCVCKNQDDCLAINRGSDITFASNTCSGGHGISVGSISDSVTVSGVQITGNTVTASTNALRIKTKAAATGSTVSGVVYSGNTASGITDYGVIIDQSYPDTDGTPGTGVIINPVTFSGTNKIAVSSSAQRVLVDCASTKTCTGTWNWAGLTVTGGKASSIKGGVVISGGSYE